jgi:hypothetical protein
VFQVAAVEPPLVVALQAVGHGLEPEVLDRRRHLGVRGVRVGEGVGGHAVQPAAGQRAVVEARAVGTESDAVGAGLVVRGLAARGADHEGLALDDREEAVVRERRGMSGQSPPGAAGGEVDHDHAVRAARVGDEHRALGAAPQVEAHVVGVAVRRHDLGREEDLLYDPVGAQVDRHEFRAAVGGSGEQRASGVEDPQSVGRVDDDALHRLEVSGQVGGVLAVHLGVGVGHRLPAPQFGDGERDVVAPAGKVDEDAAAARDGDPRRHRAPEAGNDLVVTGC